MTEALQIFNIALTSTDATYSPGEKVTGAVVIQLRRAKCLKGLKLKVKGEAEVKWIVSTDDDGNVKLDQRNEEYFRSEFYLFGGAGNTNIHELEEGPHLYPFKFSLPRNIPSTFAHKDGYVRYTIKAVWERPWSSDYTTSTTMTVEAPYDLSQEPKAMIGINDERNNSFCCFPFCIPMGSLSYNVSIPSSGFAAGETIRATISLNNGSSSVNVNAIQLELTQRLYLYGEREKRSHMITVHTVELRGPFDKREDEIVVPMKIGSLPPTTFPHCSLIDIHYVLTVCICVSGCHCNPERTYPIYIGTKPAVDFQPVPVNAETHTFRPMQPDAPSAPFFEADDDTPCIVPVPAPPRSVPPYLEHASTSTFEDPPPPYDECIASSRENLLPQKKHEFPSINRPSEDITDRLRSSSFECRMRPDKSDAGKIGSICVVSTNYTVNMAVGLQRFQIELDTAGAVFLPGETICGNVVLELGKAKSVRGVKLRFKGKGEIRWTESRGSGKNRRTTSYTAEEEYFRMDLLLLGETDGSENVEIVSGCHVFPFNFTLPPNIPNSFEHEHGHIRYSIKAIIDRPWKFDHETSLYFTVAAPFDLAQDPTSTMAIDDEEITSFCCFPCFDAGSMNVHVHIPTGGFAVGDPIEATVAINNNSSSVDVLAVKLKLRQTITLHSTSKSRNETQTVQKTQTRGPFRKKDEIMIGLQVPAVPSSNFLHTNLVDINYSLQVTLCYSGCHCSTKRELPIVIGERLNLNFQSGEHAYGIPAENSLPISTIQPNAPSAPVFGAANLTRFPVPGDRAFSEKGYVNNGPYPSNPIPPYGFGVANQPFSPSRPESFGVPTCPYPPATRSGIGFIDPNSAQVTSNTEKPPPSYDDCLNK